MTDLVGFVILNYNSSKDTIFCINSINKTYKKEKIIVIVDNCSTDDSKIIIENFIKKNKYQDIYLISTKKNGGYSYGNNQGINFLKNKKINFGVICNSDVIFLENTIEKMYVGIKESKNTVIYAPLILSSKQKPITLPWKEKQDIFQYLGIKNNEELIYSYEDLKKEPTKKVYMVSGCCFIINIEKFQKMGAFDEGVFLYNEEGIFSQQAYINKFDIVLNSEIAVIHNHGGSTGNNNLFVDTEVLISGLYYWKNYENADRFILILIWIVFIFKMFLKIALKKYRGNYRDIFKQYKITIFRTFNYLKEILVIQKGEIDED